MIEKLVWFLIIFSPLAMASWELWAWTLIHLVSLLILVEVLIKLNFTSLSAIKKTCLDLPIFFFLLFVSFSFFCSVNKYNSRNELFNLFNYVFIYYVIVNFVNTKKQINNLFNLFIFIGTVVSIIGINQWFQGINKVYASLVNPNILAGYLVMLIPLAISCVVQDFLEAKRDKNIAYSLWLIASISVMFICLMLTGSLGGILSLYLGLLIMFLFYLKDKKQISEFHIRGRFILKIPLIILVVSGILMVFLISYKLKDTEMSNRLFWWTGALKMILDRPLRGVGIGCFGDIYLKYKAGGLNSLYAHNYFLQIGAETGLLGLGAFIWIIVVGLWKLAKEVGEKNIEQGAQILPPFLHAGLLSSLSAILIFGLIEYNLFIPANALVFWIFLGVAMSNKTKAARLGKYGLRWLVNVMLILFIIIGSVVVIKPFLASQRLVWGENALKAGELSEAEALLRSSLRLDSLNPLAYAQLADVYTKMGESDKAIEQLKKAVIFSPYYADFHYNLGLLYAKQDKNNLAIDAFKEAISCHYQKIIYHQALAEMYEKQGLKDLVNEEYEIIKQLKNETTR